MKHYIKRLASQQLLQHLIFWSLSFYVLLRLFATDSELRNIDYIYDALFHLTLLPAVYFNLQLLIPKLLDRERYVLYLLGMGGSLLAFSQLNIWFFDHLVDFFLPGYYFISYYELTDILQFFGAYLIFTTLLKLSKAWFQLSEAEVNLAVTRQEKTKAELEALKSQVNPHFLFNSLNSLYALSLKGGTKASESILKLSEVMRYMIYEARDELVPLENEIAFIESYLALQQLRSDQRAAIRFAKKGETNNRKVAPLLLIPLIENSFKHGIKGETGPSFVSIFLEVENGRLLFRIENNKGQVDNVEVEKHSGMGLANVKKRLELMYPAKHELVVLDAEKTFSVDLKLNLE